MIAASCRSLKAVAVFIIAARRQSRAVYLSALLLQRGKIADFAAQLLRL